MDTMSPYPYDLPSVAVFSSQSKAAEDGYLRNIRAFLCQSQDLFPLKQSLKNLPSIWSFLSTRDPDLAALSHAPPSLQALSDWISTGNSTKISTSSFGIIALPLLTIIQLIQYYQFLRAGKITHVDFIAATRNGAGIQGYCSGLLPSAVVACSANEVELVSNACKAVRLAVGLGAYGDLGARGVPAGPTMMAIRSKYDGQAEEVVESFPEVSAKLPAMFRLDHCLGAHLCHHRSQNCHRSRPPGCHQRVRFSCCSARSENAAGASCWKIARSRQSPNSQ